ncbi:MAG TPA: DUF5049 domain-containing protein [Armatimonadota bacterium]|jgi:hypothetical protein
MRVLIKTFSARGASIADEDGRILTGDSCREIVEAMRLLAPFTGCADAESYMRWTLRNIKGAGAAASGIEGDTPEARAESFLALLGEIGLVEFLSDRELLPRLRIEDGKGPVPIPEAVLPGIEAVRQSGKTNMLDIPAVIRLAREAGHHGAADWIVTNPSAYSAGLFRGFVAHAVKEPGGEG